VVMRQHTFQLFVLHCAVYQPLKAAQTKSWNVTFGSHQSYFALSCLMADYTVKLKSTGNRVVCLTILSGKHMRELPVHMFL